MEARKDDAGKPRYDLIPPEVEEALAKVLAFGAAKYGARNWEHGMGWGRVYRALRGHLLDWWRGYDSDIETGYSHLWHAVCCLAFLIAYEQRRIGNDDRPTTNARPPGSDGAEGTRYVVGDSPTQ